ncbi:MAG: rhomboid family intramembrane serine protease [Cytophagaceae bacterium]|nr:rhomboid family intramembrane serine protease [Cytophagaceae bacterium]MDW8456279.1 rhomboid family intramembrane serine protease [Cytophagaceae bacterium]
MNLIEDLKREFRKKDNAVTKIILINVIVFIFLGIFMVLSFITKNWHAYEFIDKQFSLPSNIREFIYRPWTLITFFFAHYVGPSISSLLHIFFNMMMFFWFGKLIAEYIGNRKLINLYILGGMVSGLFYLLIYNVFTLFLVLPPSTSVVGASGAVYAVMVAAATLLPHYTFHLVFIGPVKIAYIAAALIFLSFLGMVGANAGGSIAHLGGAITGYAFIKELQRGNDLGKPLTIFFTWIGNLFAKKPKMKVSYKKKESIDDDYIPNEEEIDAILDKISRSGYNSLTKEEKQKLFKASQK